MKKKKIVLLFLLCTTLLSAQIKVTLNGKEIKEGELINKRDIKLLQVSFDSKKKLSTANNGKLTFSLVLKKEGGEVLRNYVHETTGIVSVNSYLEKTNKLYTVYSLENNNSEFNSMTGNLMHGLNELSGYAEDNVVIAEVNLYFEDKVGYDQYGSRADMLEPFAFKINTLNEDGYMAFLNLNAKIKMEKVKELNVDYISTLSSFYGSDGFVSDDVFVNPTKQYDFKLKQINSTYIFTTDANNQTQDVAIEKLIESFKLYPKEKSGTKQWSKFFSYLDLQKLDRRTNKLYKKEELFTPIELGQLKGVKLYSKKNSDPKFGTDWCYWYFFKHPIDTKKIIIMYGQHYLKYEEFEKADKSQLAIEEVIKSIQFN